MPATSSIFMLHFAHHISHVGHITLFPVSLHPPHVPSLSWNAGPMKTQALQAKMLMLECKPFWKCLRIQLEWQRQSKHHKRSRHAGCTCWCVPCVASTGRDRLLLTEWSHGLFRLKWQIGTCHFLRLKLREPTHEHFHNITLITLITSLQIFDRLSCK